jgi:potassium efflux system protein
MIRSAIGWFPVAVRRVVIAAAALAFAGVTLVLAQPSTPPASASQAPGPPPAPAATNPASPPSATQPPATQPSSVQPPAAEPPASPSAPPPASPSAAAGLNALAAKLDALEKDFQGGAQTEEGLVDLRRQLNPIQDELRGRVGGLAPPLQQINGLIGQLGPPPQNGASEDAAIASERARLATQQAVADAALKQAQLLAGRASDLDQHIDDRRRELFTDKLLARSANLVNVAFWSDLAGALRTEWRGLKGLASLWWVYAQSDSSPGGVLAFLAALGGAAWFALRWGRRLLARPTPRRFDRALAAVIILLFDTATTPVLIVAAALVLRNFGLMQYPVIDIAMGLASGAAIAGFGRGVAVGLFAPDDPGRRIIACSDRAAENCARHLIWATGALGLTVFLNAVHRAVGALAAPIIATGEMLSVLILGIMVHFLWRFSPGDPRLPEANAAEGGGFAWFRGVLLIATVAIAAALATGYGGLALFIAGRLTASLAVGGAVAVVVVFIDATFTELLASDTAYGLRAGALLGLAPRGLELIETTASALLRLVVIGLAALFLLGYSGLFTDDIFGLFRRVGWDFAIGGVNISPSGILAALVFIIAGGLAIRGAQRWLETKFLPRTGLDTGLQNSVLALFGYAGAIALSGLALAALGIDLQKIALIAGALSVGIGFGLQSVVSNFICGLILLAERPIRVGDWVVVKNEEGWVRRISVRATEIETFDRASVIIPNQEFITGVVKNWTHGDTVGRIIIKVRVTYDGDFPKVRDVLMECARSHPHVLRTPAPSVYLMAFGDIGVDFELRCILGNIEQALAIRSDIQLEVLRRFGEAGIKIPFPDHKEQPPGSHAIPPAAPPLSSDAPINPAAT